MNPREVSKELRLVQEKHKNDFTPTFGLCISDMAGDAANAIDSLISSAQFSHKHPVVTICGSTRFKDDILRVQRELTMEGKVVLSCPFFSHADGIQMPEEDIKLVDELHKQKIDMCDFIYVVNKNGYIGNSTAHEIEYAKEHGKQVIFMENLKDLRKDGYSSLADASIALNQIKKDLHIKSPGQEFLEKKFNIPICHELGQTYTELYQLAYHDPLTGCYNRNMLEKLRSTFDPKRCTVAIVDIDNFKKYNTDYGHIGGDKRLREIVDLLKANYENVFRIGGDEFMVITDAIELITVRDILNSIGGISAGVYNKYTSEDLSSAMHKADLLMYVVKNKKELNSVYGKSNF